MKIESIPTNNMDKFHNNCDIKELVNISLNHLNDDVIDNILSLISTNNKKVIDMLLSKFISDFDDFNGIYYKIRILIENIQNNKDYNNLRGVFLELLTYGYLERKYKTTDLSKECFVKIDNFKSSKTVDVFARCDLKGFICECKVSHNNFDASDISNLNEIYFNSYNILSPYIISLSDKLSIMDHLNRIVLNDNSNCIVHLNNIKIICSDNFNDFFKL